MAAKAADATLSGLSLSAGTLTPEFDPATTRYTATVESTVTRITITPATTDAMATVAYFDELLAPLPDADPKADEFQVDLAVGENTVTLEVTPVDGETMTYMLVVTRETPPPLGICGRTEQVRERIVAAVFGVTECADVTAEHLEQISVIFDFSRSGITALQADDFAGLSSLTTLFLQDNELTVLPEGVFSGLSSLNGLLLNNNDLSSLPPGMFSGLSALGFLDLSRNAVDPLPLTVSLEKVGENSFRAVAPAGAPFEMELPVTVTGGSVDSGASTLTIPIGQVESAVRTVTPAILGAQAVAVIADIGALPAIPTGHSGYALVKSAGLPLEVVPREAGSRRA